MCVGQPLKIETIDGIAAQASNGTLREVIDLSLTPDAKVGDWVLSFLGAARGIIDEDEAQKISAALDGLRALMAGDDLGDAFADIEDRGPQLPPHLAAALSAGQTTG